MIYKDIGYINIEKGLYISMYLVHTIMEKISFYKLMQIQLNQLKLIYQ